MILPPDFDFTQGNLQDYVDCPYRFYLRHILRTNWPALTVGDALEFEARMQAGARFHRLVQQYLLGIPATRVSELADEDPNIDLGTWWADFQQHVLPWLEGRQMVETVLTADLAGQRLVAKYDLILIGEDGQLTIFDWKTAQRTPTKAWLLERIQTRLYRLVLREASSILLGGQAAEAEQIMMHYWFTARPDTLVSLPYSRSAYERDREDLTRLIEEICGSERSSFTKTEDVKHCRFCVYRSHCDRGVEAGDLDDFEDFDAGSGDPGLLMDFDDIPEITV